MAKTGTDRIIYTSKKLNSKSSFIKLHAELMKADEEARGNGRNTDKNVCAKKKQIISLWTSITNKFMYSKPSYKFPGMDIFRRFSKELLKDLDNNISVHEYLELLQDVQNFTDEENNTDSDIDLDVNEVLLERSSNHAKFSIFTSTPSSLSTLAPDDANLLGQPK